MTEANEIISYNEMCRRKGVSLQRGMNSNLVPEGWRAMSSSEPGQRFRARRAAQLRGRAADRENLLKALVVVFGVPAAMWLGIDSYWSGQYQDGKVPLYVAGSMVMLRGVFHLPLQILTTAVLVFVGRRLLSSTRWLLLPVACVLACIGAVLLERGAMQMHDAGVAREATDWILDLGPHLVGIAVLTALACSGLVPRWSVPAGDQNE